MALSLIDAAKEMLDKVREHTGKVIEAVEKDDLPRSVELRMARKNEAKHILFYRPVHDLEINYILSNQCAHVLRLMESPEDQRFMPMANKRTMMSYILEMEDEFKRLLAVFGPEKIRRMIRLWYEGAVFQLTKMPPDIMIDKWLYDRYPDLRQIQLTSLNRQRQEALQSLSFDTAKFTPEKIYRVSNIMNFAFFKVLEDHFRLDWVAPYHGTIFIFEGSALAKITENEYINSHTGDRIMIDTWAERLGLKTWYEWKPISDFQ